jgi:hypothetical protein
MSDGPAPGLVFDWITPGAFLIFLCVASAAWLAWFAVHYFGGHPDADERTPAHVTGWSSVSPCVNTGHAYRAQPTVWRCANCGDTRTSEAVYDQEHAA